MPSSRTNYSYIVQDKATGIVAVVDPGDAIHVSSIVQETLKKPISIVLLTHKHWDHSGGITKLHQMYPDLESFSGVLETA